MDHPTESVPASLSRHAAAGRGRSLRRGGRQSRQVVIIGAMAAAVFLGLAAVLRWQQDQVALPAAISAQLDPSGRLRQPAEVIRLMRAMKLVTVELDTFVTVTVEHDSWRGDVEAKVRAPARLYFGTDLSRVGDGAVTSNPLYNSFVVRVPRPARIATEVFPEQDRTEVRTGWLRLRSRAGEYYLGQARRSLGEQARSLALSHEDEQAVERATREQVAELVRAFVGRDAVVQVVFTDEPASHAVVPDGQAGGAAAAGSGR